MLASADYGGGALLDHEELVGGVTLVEEVLSLRDQYRVTMSRHLVSLALRQPREQGQRLQPSSVDRHHLLKSLLGADVTPSARGAVRGRGLGRVIATAPDLHVLPRHRLLPQPHGFEG